MVRARAFSLVEFVIVTVIIGIIAAIAVPRFSRGAQSAREGSLRATVARLQSAIDRYTAEHAGLSPGHDGPGVASSDGDAFVERLIGRSDDRGQIDESGHLGPYLRSMPPNPYNGLRTVRIGGAPAGANTHGWRFGPQPLVIEPDHGVGGAEGGELVGLDVIGDAEVGASEVEIGGAALEIE